VAGTVSLAAAVPKSPVARNRIRTVRIIIILAQPFAHREAPAAR
jgi:hypothetical protein